MSTNTGLVLLNQYCTAVRQRKQIATYNYRVNRFTIPSPYPTFTQEQLNMRRKVEVLKYKSSNQNSKQNGFTKSALWSSLVKGNSNNNVSQSIINTPDLMPCNINYTAPSLTTNSDVPGPPTYLYYDPAVPLYNLASVSDRNYSILNQGIDSPYHFYTNNLDELSYLTELPNPTNVIAESYYYEVPLGAIITTNNIISAKTTFSFTTPIALWVKGTAASSGSDTPSLTISINNIVLNTYYNGVLVTSKTKPTRYDNIAYSSNFQTVQIKNISTNSPFYAIQYCGNLSVSNLTLDTPRDLIYELRLGVTFRYNYTGIMSNLAIGVFDTLNPKYFSISSQCAASSDALSSGFIPSSFINVNG